MQILLLHPEDDVALAIIELSAGQAIDLEDRIVVVREPIPAGHKLSVRSIGLGDVVTKYGQPIGRATANIAQGNHVHTHNLESLRGRGDLAASSPGMSLHYDSGAGVNSTPDASKLTFNGYRRRDGRVGVRNHVLVLATVQCANGVVDRIGREVPEVIALSHAWGCSQIGDDLAQSRRVLEEFAGHPNVGAVLLIGLGCETMPGVEMEEKLAAAGVEARRLAIQDEGGSLATAARGVAIARELLQQASRARREACTVSELVVGLECGGSDAWSGVTANPAVGVASDMIVGTGGTAVLSEVPEFIGAEHLLAARAATLEVAHQIVAATFRREAEAMRMGVDIRGSQPTPGNMAGGLTTIEEKSLGAIAKGGASPVSEFVPYAYRPAARGLVVMDTPGNDPESVTGMVAGGAQIVVFTTGRGSPTGCPIAPVIKVASNTAMYARLAGDMDLDAGTVIGHGEPMAAAGRRIYDEILAVASGKQTAAEALGNREFAINVIGPRI